MTSRVVQGAGGGLWSHRFPSRRTFSSVVPRTSVGSDPTSSSAELVPRMVETVVALFHLSSLCLFGFRCEETVQVLREETVQS